MYPLYLIRVIGAGDVKLYALIPLFYRGEIVVAIYISVLGVGAILGIFKLLVNSDIRHRFLVLVNYLRICVGHRCIFEYQESPQKNNSIPMALPMAIVVALSIVADGLGIYKL